MVTIFVTLTLYRLDWILPTKKTKKSHPDFCQAHIFQLSDLLRFILTYGQALGRIFNIEFFTFIFPVFLELVCTLQQIQNNEVVGQGILNAREFKSIFHIFRDKYDTFVDIKKRESLYIFINTSG